LISDTKEKYEYKAKERERERKQNNIHRNVFFTKEKAE